MPARQRLLVVRRSARAIPSLLGLGRDYRGRNVGCSRRYQAVRYRVRVRLGTRGPARRVPADLTAHPGHRTVAVAISPSSSVQRARQELAERLREIRLDAGLTGRALSVAAGWHDAKTSRIESAKQAPSEADIHTWCRVCSLSREAPDLIAASRAADSMYVEWRRLHRTGLRRTQESRRPLYERTRY